MGHRRQSRETALHIRYQVEQSNCTSENALSTYWELNHAAEDVKEFAEKLVFGVAENIEEIDEQITKFSAHWRLSRMAIIDRNVLRLAVYELLHCADVPVRVTLNEAIEIAKKYGTEESGAFINGILDQVAKALSKE